MAKITLGSRFGGTDEQAAKLRSAAAELPADWVVEVDGPASMRPEGVSGGLEVQVKGPGVVSRRYFPADEIEDAIRFVHDLKARPRT